MLACYACNLQLAQSRKLILSILTFLTFRAYGVCMCTCTLYLAASYVKQCLKNTMKNKQNASIYLSSKIKKMINFWKRASSTVTCPFQSFFSHQLLRQFFIFITFRIVAGKSLKAYYFRTIIKIINSLGCSLWALV